MTYDKIKLVSGRLGEANDCSVASLALVLGISYEAAHEALGVAGRAFKSGASTYVIEKAIVSLGFRVRRRYSDKRLGVEVGVRKPSTADAVKDPEAWEHLPPLLLMIDGHAAAFVNGKVEDWTSDRLAPIEEAWELEPREPRLRLGEEPPPVVYL